MSEDHPSTADLATRARWQRWEMDSLGVPKHAPQRRASDRDAEQRKQELLRHKAQTLATAQAQGLAIGMQEGREQGCKAGYDEGHAEGLAQGREEGWHAGHAQGRAEGEARAYAQAAPLATEQVAQLAALTQSCAEAIADLEEEVGQALIHLAIQIAQRVLQSTLDEHPEHLYALVREVLRTTPQHESPVQLRVHPMDLALLEGFLQSDPDAGRVRLVADERIMRGGCVAETPQGSIDATLQTRWQRVTAALGQDVSLP